jgi:chromosome segregation and condensation protein ScpB
MELPRTSSSSQLSKDIIGTLDALFFATYKPISIDTIKTVLKLENKREAKNIMEEYIKLFNKKMIGIEIRKKRSYYYPKIKDTYLDKVKTIMRPPPLTEKQLEVLAYIYANKKVKLSRLKEIFGSRIYRDIKKFIRLGLISKRTSDTGSYVEIREEAEALIISRRKKKIIRKQA